MRMLKKAVVVIIPLVFLSFTGCGKNEPVRTVPPIGYGQNGPYPQAPVPPNGGYQLPPNYMPPTSGPNPYFYPQQMPQGMPPGYTPWLPVDQYFRRYPQTTNIYINIMVDWRQYANHYGYNQYDFNNFWFNFCPTYYPQYQNVWNYFDQNVYWWMDGSSNNYCDSGCNDPGYYWSYYQGLPYDYVDNSCGGWCF